MGKYQKITTKRKHARRKLVESMMKLWKQLHQHNFVRLTIKQIDREQNVSSKAKKEHLLYN